MRETDFPHLRLTRRQCLGALSCALAAGLYDRSLFAAGDTPAEPKKPFSPIDPNSLRPRPKVRVAAAILRHPPPYWLGWPGSAYDLEAHQKDYLTRLKTSAQGLGVELLLEDKPVQDAAGMTALTKKIKEQPPDALLVILQHIGTWKWVETIITERGDQSPLLVFAPVGTAFTGHVLRTSRQPGVYVASTLEWSAVEAGLRMVRAKRMFEETRILWIRGDQRNETVMDRLGTKVRAIPRKTFNELFEQTPETAEVREVAEAVRRSAQKVVEPSEKDLMNAARAYITAKQLLTQEQSNALSMDCLGMVGAKLVPTPPCMAWSVLQDQGITAGCEADLFGAFSLMLTSYLLDRPGYMNDPVPETAKNLLIAAHCTSGTRLNGFDKPSVPYILRSHSESALGVSMQVLWPVGERVTLVRFTSPHEIIVDTGVVVSNVPTPPAGGCRTSIEIKMDNIEDVRDVLGFHQVVVLGDHKRMVESFAQLYGMRIVHSPEKAPAGRE